MKHFVLRVYLCILSVLGAVEIFRGWHHVELRQQREGILWDSLTRSIVLTKRYQPEVPRTVGRRNVALHAVDPAKVNATTLPGSFLSDKLYLMGARLTTSYDEKDDPSLIVTLFGIPGHARHPGDGTFHCKSESSRRVWSHGRTKDEMIIHVQLDCYHNGTYQPCGPPMEMTRMETISWDVNVEKLSLIWQTNITSWVAREDLRLLPSERQLQNSIRAHFSVGTGRKTHSKQHREIHPILSVDIPLATGSVGNVGPSEPIRTNTHGPPDEVSYFAHPPVGAALCVATFGPKIQKFLPEFLEHHRNMGFEHIVLGVLDSDVNKVMPNLTHRLSSYIQDGSVVLVPAAAPQMQCHTELLKVAFYNSCLYHAKGIAEYVGVWDVDEYWVPPDELLGRNDSERSRQRNSYVVETMERIKNHHRRYGCGERDWCFHGFPSYTVHRRQTNSGKEVAYDSRQRLVDLFERRDKTSNTIWLKSIAKTKYTYSAGYHEFGSCQRPKNATAHPWDVFNPGEDSSLRELDYSNGNNETPAAQCRNLRRLGFGSMHHFKNLVTRRGTIPNLRNGTNSKDDAYPRDEYIEYYARPRSTTPNLL